MPVISYLCASYKAIIGYPGTVSYFEMMFPLIFNVYVFPKNIARLVGKDIIPAIYQEGKIWLAYIAIGSSLTKEHN